MWACGDAAAPSTLHLMTAAHMDTLQPPSAAFYREQRHDFRNRLCLPIHFNVQLCVYAIT